MSSYLLDARAGGGGGLQEVTLADVAGFSVTTPDQTFSLNAATQADFVASNGTTPILRIGEATKHIAVGPDAVIDGGDDIYPGDTFSNIITYRETFDISTAYSTGAQIFLTAEPAAPSVSWMVGADIELFVPVSNTIEMGRILGLYGGVTNNGSGALNGVSGLLYTAVNNGPSTVQHMAGIAIGVEHNGDGHVDDIIGLNLYAGNYGSGDADEVFGIYIDFIEGGATNVAILTTKGDVIFNEGSDNTAKFRVEGATNTHLLYLDGPTDRVGINDATPDGKLDVIQSSTTAAIPVIELEQLDLSEEFFNFVGTVAVGNPIEAVGAKVLTTTHFIRVGINGAFRYIPVGTIA